MPHRLTTPLQRKVVADGYRDLAFVVGCERQELRNVLVDFLREDEVDGSRMARMILSLGIYVDLLLQYVARQEGLDPDEHLRGFLEALEQRARLAEEGTAADWQLAW